MAYAASGACFAVCVLSKETYLLMLPALVVQAWISAERTTRRMAMTLFSTVFLVVAATYPLYAALKGELIPGRGHVRPPEHRSSDVALSGPLASRHQQQDQARAERGRAQDQG